MNRPLEMNRSLKLLSLLFIAAFTVSPAQAEMKTGAYRCVAEALVGEGPQEPPPEIIKQGEQAVIEWMDDTRNWVGGRYQVSPDPFVIKISKFAWDSKKQQEERCHPGLYWTELNLAIKCSGFPLHVLELPPGKNDLGRPLYSTGSDYYTDGVVMFHFDEKLGYRMAELGGPYGNFIERGHCKAVE